MDDIAIYRINSGDGDGADVIFDYNDKRISVSIFPSILPPYDNRPDKHGYFAEDHLIDLLDRAVSFEIDDDEYEDIMDEALSIILDAGKTLFADLKSHRLVTHSTQDLHSILYPESLFFRLLTTSGKASLIPIESKEAYTCPEAISDSNFGSDLNTNNDGLPRYSPKDILIEEVFVQGGAHAVCRVLVDSKVMLCKAWKTGLSNLNLERELAKLQKVREADLHMRLPARVPRLLGYVTHPTADCVLGLLREWVPGRCLRNIAIPSTVEGRRRKWASQIRETINQLHTIDVLWGDGKAGNIIIDTEDDAWLIDFGGGWTEGWVDEELADTVEGDEQAVKRIMQFIDVE